MATIPGTGKWIKRGVHKTIWASLANDDVGSGQSLPDLPDKNVQVVGANYDGGTITIEGSDDEGVTFSTLNDPQGNPLTFTVDKSEQLLENPELIRPRASGGGASMDVSVRMVANAAT